MLVKTMTKPTVLTGENSPLKKLPRLFPLKIDESLALGLDLGVGSCGQALVYDSPTGKVTCNITGLPEFPNRIAFLGVRAFDIPETKAKSGVELKNPERRANRLARRTIRRRAQRMWAIRRLLKDNGILPDDYPTDEELWKTRPSQPVHPAVKKWSVWHARMTEEEDGGSGKPGPLELRVRALDQKLDSLEWAAALLHLAKHRGFRSNRKSASGNDDDGKVLAAINENERRMEAGAYRTVAEMYAIDAAFSERKRNRAGVYTAVIQRKDQNEEIVKLFENQRRYGSLHASKELENAYLELFNKQLPLKNSLNLLGDCPFEEGEKRGPRGAYSFELCRALQRLNTLTLKLADGTETSLPNFARGSDGYQLFCDRFGDQKKISYRDLRSIFDISQDIVFSDLPVDPAESIPLDATAEDQAKLLAKQIRTAENKDFVTRTRNAAEESYRLQQAIGAELWKKYRKSAPQHLDAIAFALSFFEEIENDQDDQAFWGIVNQLRHDTVPDELIDVVNANLRSEKPTLHKFGGTTSISLLASRKLIPLLAEGMLYSDACTQLYGDHRQSLFAFDSITNPVVRSVVRETMKQVVHLIDETGRLPGRICVEIGRDLGKSVKDRNEIDQEIKKRTRIKKANAKTFTKLIGREPGADELLAYELYLEQSTLCPYCGQPLPNPLTWQGDPQDIDHILPRSRSHDNSYDNKVHVHKHCNRNKNSQTPSEWFGEDSERWLALQAAISQMPKLRPRKRRNLLNTTFATDEAKLASRHLNDTRYISKLITHYLHALYEHVGEVPVTEKGGKKRVFVQPGALTSLVRKSWGLENLKKDRDGRRLGDKHHAIDALICALLSEGQRQFVTRSEQNKRAGREVAIFGNFSSSYELMERKNDHCRTPRGVQPPWKDFRNDVVTALDLFTVSRRENRKGRGSLHNATLYRVETEGDAEICYSRKPIDAKDSRGKLIFSKLSALDKIKDIDSDRNGWLKESLTNWIEAGSPLDDDRLPRDPQGAVIRKITMRQGKKSGRHYPQGFVTGGDQVRLDVFSITTARGTKNYALVPVYAYHLADAHPPDRAIVANKAEEDWDVVDNTYRFEFSLWQNSRVEINKKSSAKKPDGEYFVGLYKGVNRNTGAFQLANPDDGEEQQQLTAKTGTLLFRKIETDRLGREYIVKNEKRTWRGKTVG